WNWRRLWNRKGGKSGHAPDAGRQCERMARVEPVMREAWDGIWLGGQNRVGGALRVGSGIRNDPAPYPKPGWIPSGGAFQEIGRSVPVFPDKADMAGSGRFHS